MSKFVKISVSIVLAVALIFSACLSAVAAAPIVETVIEDTTPTFDTNRIIVKYKTEQTSYAYSQNQLSATSQKLVKPLKSNIFKNTDLVSVDNISDMQTALQALQNDPTVEYALPDTKVFSMSDHATAQEIVSTNGSSAVGIDVVSAWEISTGSDVVIAMLDSGVDINHPDLKNNIFANKLDKTDSTDNDNNGYIDDTYGWDFVNNDSSVFDQNEDVHGTAVAGIIAALNNNSGVTGVAYNSKILPLKVMENGEGYVSDVIEAISYAKAMGAMVVNCSWGSSEYNYALKDAMRSSGLLFVCSAGNYGAESICYPAGFSLSNVISVGAVDNTDAVMLSSGSADVYAPGKDIYTTALNNSYAYFSGTSFSAGYVTGTAALIKSAVPSIMASQIKAAIKASTDQTKIISALKAVTAALPINYLPENSSRLNRALEYADILINAPVAEILATCTYYSELNDEQKNTLAQFFGFNLSDMQAGADNSLDLIDSIIAVLSANRAQITLAQVFDLMTALPDQEQFDNAISYISDVKEIIELTSSENSDVIELAKLGYTAEDIALAIVFARVTNIDLLSSVTNQVQTTESIADISDSEIFVAFTIIRKYNIKADVLKEYLQSNQITANELYENLLALQKSLGFSNSDGKITAFSSFTPNIPYYNKYKVTNGYTWQHGNASVDQTDGMLSYSVPLLSLAGRNGLDLNLALRYDPEVAYVARRMLDAEQMDCKYILNLYMDYHLLNTETYEVSAEPAKTDHWYYEGDRESVLSMTESWAHVDGTYEDQLGNLDGENVVFRVYYRTETDVYVTDESAFFSYIDNADFYNYYEDRYNIAPGWALSLPSIENTRYEAQASVGTQSIDFTLKDVYHLHLPDGRKYRMIPDGDTYTLDGYLYESLQFVTNKTFSVGGKTNAFSLYDKKDNVTYYFDSLGLYLGAEDNFGNKIEVYYNTDDTIQKICDTAGRQILISYNQTDTTRTITVALKDNDDTAAQNQYVIICEKQEWFNRYIPISVTDTLNRKIEFNGGFVWYTSGYCTQTLDIESEFFQYLLTGVTETSGAQKVFEYRTLTRKYGAIGNCTYPSISKIYDKKSATDTEQHNIVQFQAYNYPYERVLDNPLEPIYTVVNKYATLTQNGTYTRYWYNDNLALQKTAVYSASDDFLLSESIVLNFNSYNNPTLTENRQYSKETSGYTISLLYQTWDRYGNIRSEKTRTGSKNEETETLNDYYDSRSEIVYGDVSKSIPTEIGEYNYAEEDNEYGTKTFNTIDSVTGKLLKSETYLYNFTTKQTVKKLSMNEYTYDIYGNVLTDKYSYSPDENALTDTNVTSSETHYAYDTKYNVYPTSISLFGVKDADGVTISNSTNGAMVQQFTYDVKGQVVSGSQPFGTATAYTYNAVGALTNTAYSYNGTALGSESYQYDYANNTVIYTAIDGSGNKLVYDSLGNLTSVYTFGTNGINNLELRATYAYDTKQQLVTETAYISATDTVHTNYEYDSFGRTVSVSTVDSNNNQLLASPEYEYTQQLVSGELLDVVTTSLYNNGTLLQANKTSQFYDLSGRLKMVEYFTENNISYHTDNTYTDYNNLSLVSGDFVRTTKYVTDPVLRTARVYYGTNNYQDIYYESGYNGAGQVIWQKDANGNITKFTYDILGRTIITQNPVSDTAFSKTKNYYDKDGNLVKVSQQQNTAGQTESYIHTYYTYDYLGRVVSEKVGSEYTVYDYGTYVQNPTNNPYRVFVGLDGLINPSTVNADNYDYYTFTYDEYWSVTSMARPEDTDTTKEVYTYNNLSQLTSKRTHSGKTINYTYDLLGNVIAVTSGNEQIVYEYNILGQVTSSLRKKDNVNDSEVTFTYDALGRVTEENTYDYAESIRYKVCYTYTGDKLTEQKVYKYLGNIATNSNATLVVQEVFEYNSNEQIISKQYDAFNLKSSYSYDNNGNLISTVMSGDFGDVVEQKTYTPTNSVASITHYETWNSSTEGSITRSEEYIYDFAGRLYEEKKLQTSSAGYDETTNPLIPYERSVYGYDSAGRFSTQQYYTYSQQDSVLVDSLQYTTTNSHSAINNLAQQNTVYTNGKTATQNYVLDDNGRLTRQLITDQTTNVSQVINYTYDTDGNRLTQSENGESYTYSYSQFGELTGVTKTVYDSLGVGITTNIAYRYDALGRRIHKVAGEECYAAAFIGSNIVYEHLYTIYDIYGTSYRHFHGVSGYEGSTIWGAPFIARKNYKGDVIEYIYYPTHELISQDYSNYGDTLSTRTYDYYPLPPYGYSSGYTDAETGLQYLINRYYDPAAARFTQEDNNFIDGYNLYAYCANDPINYTDPFGRCCGFNMVWNTAYTSQAGVSITSAQAHEICLEYDAHSQGYASRQLMLYAMSLRSLANEVDSANLENLGEHTTQEISYPIFEPIDSTSNKIPTYKKYTAEDLNIYITGTGENINGKVNIELMPNHIDPRSGKLNPNIKIYDSYKIDNAYEQRVILTLLVINPLYDSTIFTRTINSYLSEWQAHNLLYNFSFFSKHLRERFGHADLDERASALWGIEW